MGSDSVDHLHRTGRLSEASCTCKRAAILRPTLRTSRRPAGSHLDLQKVPFTAFFGDYRTGTFIGDYDGGARYFVPWAETVRSYPPPNAQPFGAIVVQP